MDGTKAKLLGDLKLTSAKLIKTVVETKEQTKRLYRLVGDEIPLNPAILLADELPEETTEYFVASRIHAADHGDWETLLFPSDNEGNIISFLEFWGTRGWETIEDTVHSFISRRNIYNEDERLCTCKDSVE